MGFIARDLTREFHEAGLGDHWGPELVVGIFDSEGSFRGSFVGDNTSLCPPDNRIWNGGIRDVTNPRWINVSPLEHCALNFRNLARPMTLKHPWCYPRNEIPSFGLWGGGKGTAVREGFGGSKEEFFAEWTRALGEFKLADGRKLLGEAFIGGADAGLNEDDLALICKVAGSNQCVTGGPGYYPYEKSGITGRVLLRAAKVLVEADPQILKTPWGPGIKLGIYGFGNVGQGVARGLAVDENGEIPLILAASNQSAREEKERARNGNPYGVFDTHGLNPSALLAAARNKEEGLLSLIHINTGAVSYPSFMMPFDDLIDVLVLAVPFEGVINKETAYRAAAKVILSGTNSGITEEGYEILHQRGKIAPPDFVVNIGAASTAKSSWHGLTDKECETLAFRAIETNLRWLWEESKNQNRSMRVIALEETYKTLTPLKR